MGKLSDWATGSPTTDEKTKPENAPDGEGPEVSEETTDVEAELIEELGTEEGSETEKEGEEGKNEAGDIPFVEAETINFNEVHVSGAFVLMVTDAVIPKLLIGGAKMVGYKTKVEPEEMIMTKEERKEMEPLADAVAKDFLKNMPPWQQFLAGLAIIYGSKL